MKRPHPFERGLRIVFCTGAVALLAQAEALQAQEPSVPPPQSEFADAGGVRLHFIDFGGDGLPVILVPAVTRDATHYEPLGPLLTDGNRVLAITRRGDGESEDPGAPYDAVTQARDFLHFMDALEIPQAVFVSNVGDEITYLAEAHPHRVAGLIFLGGPARGPTGKVMKTEPTGMHEAFRRLWQSAAGLPPDYEGYIPRYLASDVPTIDAPALVFVTADGMRGVEGENPALMMVGSPLTAEVVRGLRPEDGRAHFEQLANDPEYRDRTLAAIPDPVARSYFQRLAADAELQAQALRFHEDTLLPAEIAHWGAFRRAFSGRLEVVELELPAVSGYEYNSDPELIAPHLRRFLDHLGLRGSADTVHVVPPTGESLVDRASILAALAQVQPGGTVQFAPGMYLVGEVISIPMPRITLLGHPQGTTLRGCELYEYDAMTAAVGALTDRAELWAEVSRCGMLELTGGHVTVRGLTFEHTQMGVILGHSFFTPTYQDFAGGYLIEGNTFRNSGNGIRPGLWATEPTIIRGNTFVNTFHAVSNGGMNIHVLDNTISAPDPTLVPGYGHPSFAIALGAAPPGMMDDPDGVMRSCEHNIIADNRIDGYPQGILLIAPPGATCRNNVIRDNTISVRRTRIPPSMPGTVNLFPGLGDSADSMVVGVPVTLIGLGGADEGGVIEETVIEGNRIIGAEGLGIELVRAHRNRVVDNIISGIGRREPFPGNGVGFSSNWRDANGSGIWVSPGSDENEIAGNTFADVAGPAIYIEGDRNRVERRSPDDGVHDLGSDNRTADTVHPTLEAVIRRTSYGVAHIEAADLASLGFGEGYAQAEDHLCTISDQVVLARGERAMYFGRGQGDRHLISDIAMRALRLHDEADAWHAAQPAEVRDWVGGFVAGFNQFLAETGAHAVPGWCRGEPWVVPISATDLAAYHRMLTQYGPLLAAAIARAQPPSSETTGVGAGQAAAPGPDISELLAGLGSASNGWAFGRDRTLSGGGLLVANPHHPWTGSNRFWEKHLTIPGDLDVYGVNLIGVPGVLIGFNEQVAWTHTVSAASPFTFYSVDLVHGEPTRYRYGDRERTMEAIEVTVPVAGEAEPVRHTAWRTHYGSLLTLPDLPWTAESAFTMRDATEHHPSYLAQILATSRAGSLAELQRAHAEHQAVNRFTTVAVGADGTAWFLEGAATPDLDGEALAAWAAHRETDPLSERLWRINGIALLDGSDPRFEWRSDPESPHPGVVPFRRLPQLERTDFLFNSNNSFWMPHPEERIEGDFSPLLGAQRAPLRGGLRVRETARHLADRADARVSRAGELEAVLSNRSPAADLLRDELVDRCRATPVMANGDRSVNLAVACDVLANWDGRFDLHSRGAVLFREWIGHYDLESTTRVVDGRPHLFAVDFDPDDPVGTPRGLAPGPVALENLAKAVALLEGRGIEVDVPLGELQYAPSKLPRHLPVHGANQWEGVKNMMLGPSAASMTTLEPTPLSPIVSGSRFLTETGYPILHGSSFILAVEFTGDGPHADAILSYGQSGDPGSEHFTDQTEMFARKEWRPVLFRADDIARELRREYTVRQSPGG